MRKALNEIGKLIGIAGFMVTVLHGSFAESHDFSGCPSLLQVPDTVTSELKFGRDVQFRQKKADVHLLLAEMNEKEHQKAQALHNYFTAIFELEIIGDSLRIADVKERIGKIFKDEGLLEKAIEYDTAAEMIYIREGAIEQHGNLLQYIGETYAQMGEYTNALNYYRRAGEIYRQNGADSSYILICFLQNRCFNSLKEYDKSLENDFIILDHYRNKENRVNEAVALSNVGTDYRNLGKYYEAMEYFRKAASLEVSINGSPGPATLVNQAIVYQNLGDDKNALSKLHEASEKADNLKDRKLAAEYYHLTALVYFNLGDYHNSLVYNNSCISLAKKNNQADLLERAYLLSSSIHERFYNYEEAMDSYHDHLAVKDSLRRQRLMERQRTSDAQLKAEEISRETENLWAAEELSYLELQRLKLDSANRQQELEILYKTDSIQRITIRNQQLENQRAQQALLLKEEQVYAARKAKEVDSLRSIEKIQQLNLEKERLIRKDKEAQVEIAALELRKVKTRNKWLVVFGVLAILIIYLVIRGLRYAKRTNSILRKQNNEIERQRDEIEYERQRSDKLLLNILPEETAEELKEKGSATPRHYQMVSVLFTDFKGFTKIAEKLTPGELVEELDSCFLEFDRIIDRHKLEKIKTIGDAYMCAGGIPVANETNPVDIVRAGLEIKSFMDRLKTEREASGLDYWELRIGIHTGPVIAGVVGKNKFAYDIWGDAVNTASRMESSGIPGKVNISGATYQLVKDEFHCTYRGKVQAKNKGEVDMYIVEGPLQKKDAEY